MFRWLSNQESTTTIPDLLNRAYSKITTWYYQDRYRSRNPVPIETIMSAFSWLYLPKADMLVANKAIRLTTRTLSRGITTETAVSEARSIIDSLTGRDARQRNTTAIRLIVFNTSTNADAETALLNLLRESHIAELNVRTLITTTPNHRAYIFRIPPTTENPTDNYIILSNVLSETFVWKASAAILQSNLSEQEYITDMVNAWLTGDRDIIAPTIDNIYAEYIKKLRENSFENTFKALETAITLNDDNRFINQINSVNNDINRLLESLHQAYAKLDVAKAALLQHKLEGSSEALNALKQFLTACQDKIDYIEAVDGKYLILVYKTPLLYFDPSLMRNYFSSTRENCVNTQPQARQQLLKDLFIEQTHQLLIETPFQLDLRAGYATFIKVQNLNPLANLTNISQLHGVYNPHHYYYNCWGDNEPEIVANINENKLDLAVAQCFAAIAGINLADSAVIQKFVNQELYEFENVPCILVKDTNEIITIAEYERRYNDASNTND